MKREAAHATQPAAGVPPDAANCGRFHPSFRTRSPNLWH